MKNPKKTNCHSLLLLFFVVCSFDFERIVLRLANQYICIALSLATKRVEYGDWRLHAATNFTVVTHYDYIRVEWDNAYINNLNVFI